VTTIRPYRGALSLAETASLLNELAGSQLDPHIVAAWLKLIKGAVDAAPGPREAVRETLTVPTGRP
jgi:HD-GYP domain-containing protein (c-di-GMP phosphodiesterase class II)